MIEKNTLFETDVSKALPTFDQIVQRYRGELGGVDVSPNYRQDAELVVEPITGGQCVSFRDTGHRSLLTFIAGRGGGISMTAQAAVYGELRDILKERQNALASAAKEAGMDLTLEAVEAFRTDVMAKLDEICAIARESVVVKKETGPSRIRSAAVIEALVDARKLVLDRILAARAVASE